MEGYPNTWVKRSPLNNKAGPDSGTNKQRWAVMTVYVDDFVVSGRCLAPLWFELRKHVTMCDPEPSGKILGCHFKVPKQGTKTQITQDMSDFLRQSVEKYESCGDVGSLNKVDTPSIDVEDDGKPGLLASHAASLLMKPFYAARCCRPDLMIRTLLEVFPNGTPATTRNCTGCIVTSKPLLI
jgi:hypothetical protein